VRIQSKKRALQTLAELLGASIRENLGIHEPVANDGDELPDPASFKAQTYANEAKSKEEKAKKAKSKNNATGLGHGVALPHSRLSAIDKPMAAMITLDKGARSINRWPR